MSLSKLCEKNTQPKIVHPIVTDQLQCQMQDMQSNPPTRLYSSIASAF